MKICPKCNTENKDENMYCSGCGIPLPIVQAAPASVSVSKKQTFTFWDILSIFSFVASIMGCFCVWLVFEPAAILTALIGFFKGKRFKSLTVAAIIIAVVGFIIQLFITLYKNGIIDEWIVKGLFH